MNPSFFDLGCFESVSPLHENQTVGTDPNAIVKASAMMCSSCGALLISSKGVWCVARSEL